LAVEALRTVTHDCATLASLFALQVLAASVLTSSEITTNFARVVWPKEVVIAQSVASRPVAINMRR
jgi:hypothetical protein